MLTERYPDANKTGEGLEWLRNAVIITLNTVETNVLESKIEATPASQPHGD